MYYDIDRLYLCLTRKCTLRCKHCLRGDSQKKDMTKETIDSVFNRVIHVGKLLLSGGEPLLAISQINWIIEAIKRNRTLIDEITIVTNGTVLNENIIQTLKRLSEIANIRISVSDDIFHQLELDRIKIREIRDTNISILKSMFDTQEYDFANNTRRAIYPIGRAQNLTQEELDEINSKSSVKYYFESDFKLSILRFSYNNGYIIGELAIDANGNVVGNDLPYDQEDALASEGDFNVEKEGLANAVKNYILHFQKQSEEEENKGHSQK